MEQSRKTQKLFTGLARAFGGAVFFSLPLLMTMEMWWLGFYMDRLRLGLFMIVMIPVLIGLDRFSGFEATSTWVEDAVDGMIAFGVGLAASTLVLLLIGVLRPTTPWAAVIGMVSLQAVPASFGAVLATSQLGGEREQQAQDDKDDPSYATELFFMAVGALFLAFNVAPTEEMILIAYKMTPWHAIVAVVASIAMMHAFVYAVEFHGTHAVRPGTRWWSVFLRFTVVGYVVALLISAYVLWTFGRFDDGALSSWVITTVVLGVPASLGASAARLIL